MIVVPFAGDQSALPAQQGIRSDQRVELTQSFAAQRARFPSQSTPLGVREPNAAPCQTLFEDSVLRTT